MTNSPNSGQSGVADGAPLSGWATWITPAIAWSVTITLIFTAAISVCAQSYPLKVSANHRFLEDQTGKPIFMNGDSPWSLVVQPTYAQTDMYLKDRAARGFNAILVNLIDHQFGDRAPSNIAGQPPFTGAPFATPNEAYFAHADSIIERANQLSIIVLLDPMYLGYACGEQGWCAEVTKATIAEMQAWGRYVGDRYKKFPNIVWVIGGDTDPAPVQPKVDSMVAQLRIADSMYPNRLVTTHSERGTQAITHWPETWVTLNNIYATWADALPLADAAYDRSAILPFFLIEGSYENEKSATTRQLRLQAYRTILKGGCGHLFGNCPIWGFSARSTFCKGDWQAQLDSPGAISMSYFGELFRSRNWFALVPDTGGSVLTAGADTGTNMATFARASDSTVIIGYLPSRRSVSIDPNTLRGDSIRVWWYDPAKGAVTCEGMFKKATRRYDPPASSEGDWVIVVDAIPASASHPNRR